MAIRVCLSCCFLIFFETCDDSTSWQYLAVCYREILHHVFHCVSFKMEPDWLFNIAKENGPFMDDLYLPMKNGDFPIATLNKQTAIAIVDV